MEDIKIKELIEKIVIGKKAVKYKKNIFTSLRKLKKFRNNKLNSLISYELQSGQYIQFFKKNKKQKDKYLNQLFKNLLPFLKNNQSFLEVGVGECTTMLPLYKKIKKKILTKFYGLDFSLSRILAANKFLKTHKTKATLINGELDAIPLDNNSIDIVYSSHSIEPNRGKEKDIISEMLRVSRKYVFLFEPIYELNPIKNKKRMEKFKYAKNLKKICAKLNFKIIKYKLLDFSENNKNLTGVIILKKTNIGRNKKPNYYVCPITKNKLIVKNNFLKNKKYGFLFPIYKNIPILISNKYILNLKN